MKFDLGGKTLCGNNANELGIRPKVDITLNTDGLVHPKTGLVRPEGAGFVLGCKGQVPAKK